MKCTFLYRVTDQYYTLSIKPDSLKYFLILIASLLLSACSPQNEGPKRSFYTPENWSTPIDTNTVQKVKPTPVPEIKEKPSESPPKTVVKEEQMHGYASWYGPGFHGGRTANGETYDQDKLTAAHKFLPMNSMIKVTNQENKKSVIVRINDRGPYKKQRIIDLTRRAALELDFLNEGTALVSLDVIKYPESFDQNKGLKAYKQVVVQLAVFSSAKRAKDFHQHIQGKYPSYPVIIDPLKAGTFHVAIGPYPNRKEAKIVGDQLKKEGINNFVRSYRK